MAKPLRDGIYCAKDGTQMRRGVLPQYEYEEGYPLHNVAAYLCPKCGRVFFTEQQAADMEQRTRERKEYSFGFERKVMVSGKSLVVGIPAELAEHLKIKRGQKVMIVPMARDAFMIRKTA